MKIFFTLFLICSIVYNGSAQFSDPNIDPEWQNYYKQHPSEISNKHSGSDFISVMEIVGFSPVDSAWQGNTMKVALLRLDSKNLNQMAMDGEYYAKSIKHDDYFLIYNLYYKQISKTDWDIYCPYLLPLMHIDRVVSLY